MQSFQHQVLHAQQAGPFTTPHPFQLNPLGNSPALANSLGVQGLPEAARTLAKTQGLKPLLAARLHSQALRFGNGKKADDIDLTTDYPWTKSVYIPKITEKDTLSGFMTERNLGSIDPKKIGQVYKNFVKSSYNSIVFALFTQPRSKKYLPKTIRNNIFKYKWLGKGWVHSLSNRQKYKLHLKTLEGPIAIKAMQAEVEMLNSEKVKIQNLHKLFTTGWKDFKKNTIDTLKKTLEENNEGAIGLRIFVARLMLFTMGTAGRIYTSRQLKKLETYKSLLNEVPKLAHEDFKPQLENLIKSYNDANSQDPIELQQALGNEGLKSGSVARVYFLKTKSGKEIVAKVLRPDAFPEKMDEFKPYRYYVNMTESGSDQKAQKLAAIEADATVEMIKREADFRNEAQHITALQAEMGRLNIPTSLFEIPTPILAQEKGILFEKVGDNDLVDLKPEDQNRIRLKIAPKLIEFILFSRSKLLDCHSGNCRVGKNDSVYLIDHGRTARVEEKVQKQYFKLMTLLLGNMQGKWDQRRFLSEDVLNSLEELINIQGKMDQNSLYLKALKDIKILDVDSLMRDYNKELSTYETLRSANENTKKQPELIALEEKLKPVFLIYNLFEQLIFTPKSFREEKEDRFVGEIDNTKENSVYRSKDLALLSLWMNYVRASKSFEHGQVLPQLTEFYLAPEDQFFSMDKLVNFIRPALISANDETQDTAHIQQLKNASIEWFKDFYDEHRIWASPKTSLGRFNAILKGESDLTANEKIELSRLEATLDGKKASVAERETTIQAFYDKMGKKPMTPAEHKKRFEEMKANWFDTDTPERRMFLTFMRAEQRCAKIVEELLPSLLEETEIDKSSLSKIVNVSGFQEKGKLLSETLLKQNLSKALMQEFKVNLTNVKAEVGLLDTDF